MPNGEGGQGINGGLTQDGVRKLHEAEIKRIDEPLRQQEAGITKKYNDEGDEIVQGQSASYGMDALDRSGSTADKYNLPEKALANTIKEGLPQREPNIFKKIAARFSKPQR